MTTVLALLAFLGSSQWEVSVRSDTGAVVESYLAESRPVRDGESLCFPVAEAADGLSGESSTREVCTPAERTSYREVRRKGDGLRGRKK